MNKFEKVSESEFQKVLTDKTTASLDNAYRDIKLPRRATNGSAGYDFFAPFAFTLKPGETITIPTGIKVHLDNDKFLALFPRSGLGYKYRCQLDNTVGIIDSDYINSDNEGHIFVKITNDSRNGKTIVVDKGSAFIQGVIMSFFKTEDDSTDSMRNGGFGSTDRR